MWDPRRGVHYPFGTHQWKVMSVLCGLEAGMAVNLTLSVCGKGMFTCEDGTCISLQKRCDLRVDCPDQSDEHQCSLVDVPQDYQNNIPPQPTVLNQSLAIHFTINIISFPSVATQDLTFVTTFQLLLRWRDPRLSYLNLKTDRTLNMLSEDNKRRIWTPRVFFSNAHGNVFTNLNQGSRVECVQEGSSTVGGPHHTREVNIFSGSENSLEMGQLYSVTYSCDFELLMFPFDAQVCTMKFMLVSASASYMTLVPTLANYTGKTSLIEYAIGHLTMNTLPNEEFSSVAVEVRFMRRYGFYLLTLYIPTTLLMLIAYATLYFNPDDFNSRIVVALTSLLVLSSLFTQTSNSLPKTSYFKLVDVWLFFSIVMIFNVVMLQTLVDFSQQAVLNKGSRLARAFKKIHKFLRKLGNNKDVGQGTPVQDLRASGVIITHTKTAEEAEQEEPWAANGNNWHREEPSRLPIYGRAFRRKNWSENKDVNMSLMTFSRIILPVIFCIFNACYWGAAIVHVNTLDKGT
ncbi:glycine receptor subunit alpha-2-like [Scylla paramamosain]|uniref:glycine receptor subunit alpha-2-like n=1 Tax=Scylla paramamosain TaxID=85552 RepID=UPI003083ACD3